MKRKVAEPINKPLPSSSSEHTQIHKLSLVMLQ